MKRVLITGSAGFVGSHLVEHILVNTDWEIIGIDSFRHRGDSLRVLGDPSRYRIFCHDLSAPISERLALSIGPVDYIINMASESHVDRSITDPASFIQNNVNLAINVLEYARKAKPEAFIQISTDEVYGAAHGISRHAEWSPIIPSNPYSASKAAQEAIAISYWRTFNIPLILTNTMNMIGERQDREKYIPMLISKISNLETVQVHGNLDYIGKRFYLHARNHADALLFLLDRKNESGSVSVARYRDSDSLVVPDRWNIVGDIEMDNLQIAWSIANILDKELDYELVDFHAARPGHDRRYALDGRKLADAGWKAPVPFFDSLRRTVEWTLANPHWLAAA